MPPSARFIATIVLICFVPGVTSCHAKPAENAARCPGEYPMGDPARDALAALNRGDGRLYAMSVNHGAFESDMVPGFKGCGAGFVDDRSFKFLGSIQLFAEGAFGRQCDRRLVSYGEVYNKTIFGLHPGAAKIRKCAHPMTPSNSLRQYDIHEQCGQPGRVMPCDTNYPN